jgi:HAMP domain-containing protein
MFWKSIRFRLALWYSAVLLMTLIAFGVFSYLYVKDTLYNNLDYSLRSEIDWLKWKVPETEKEKTGRSQKAKRTPRTKPAVLDTVKILAQADTTDRSKQRKGKPQPKKGVDSTALHITKADSVPGIIYDETWNQIYEHTLKSSKNQYYYVVDHRSGTVIFASPNLKTDTLSYVVIPEENKTFVLFADYRSQTLRIATLKTASYTYYVGYPVDEITQILSDLFLLLVYLVPIALIGSFIGGWFLAKKSLQPVDVLTRTAREITATNLKQQIPQKHVNDEIGRLTATLNEMIARLAKSFEQIRQFSVDASHELKTPLTIMRG